MKVNKYLDSTYLKTAVQANISEEATKKNVQELVVEAIENNFVLAMIRPQFVAMAREIVKKANSETFIGTVIGFHEGTNSTSEKLDEAQIAIDNDVDELDYVVNYDAFKEGKINLVKAEVYKGTKLALDNNKVAKWIIEIAALTNEEIISITQLIRDVVLDNFGEEKAAKVFVKSSTGFYKTEEGKPNGATFEAMKLIVENAKPLPAKAAGGVRSFDDAVKMVELGVTRIGTSSAKLIADGGIGKQGY
ncbi:MAG: deoxyribose-phosphate aldolase [Lutibacter sp.]|uniref:deoxyribose-phosphate aldolase n=1 Tax=Lutibacter sp. TaxID=1925666 RepID=UPI0017C47DE2|nr:deoxyribose-phosphate aldolase [Lutibacter sp.]MBT8316462.1 deoxyribose-phosphate aldolase [Lutibacter sp.]NNJ57322.1 deoxyribose-phosphate aldolase [Lutibacter sp.]